MRVLAIDCGNSRLKWAVHDPARGWLARGESAYAVSGARLVAGWREHGPLAVAAIANVAGDAARALLEESLAELGLKTLWVRADARGFGVVNGYSDPQRLGADRWAALVGARALCAGDCLVVMAGTATTIDWLESSGRFAGGMILPGAALMKTALARDTAGLPLAQGRWSAVPDNTDDAIESGCLEAQAGAIERMRARLPHGAACLLSGGAAAALEPLLGIPVIRVDNLVLDGLARIGGAVPVAETPT